MSDVSQKAKVRRYLWLLLGRYCALSRIGGKRGGGREGWGAGDEVFRYGVANVGFPGAGKAGVEWLEGWRGCNFRCWPV